MAVAWHTSLPTDILSDGFNQQTAPNAIRTKMEAGLDKLRRRYTTEIVNISVSMVVTFAEYTILETFFNTTLEAGTLSFNFTDPVDSTEYEYRFLEPPAYSVFNSYNYLVSMQWERID